MITAATAVIFLGLVASSLLLTLPAHVECTARDPDDDSWSNSDSIGLAGGDQWTAGTKTSYELPVAGAATDAETRRDDSTSGDIESDDGDSSAVKVGRGHGGGDLDVGKGDSGVGDSDVNSDDNSDTGTRDSDAGDDSSDYGVGDVDTGDDKSDNVADYTIDGADDSDLGIEDTDYVFDDDDIDFNDDDFGFNDDDFGFDADDFGFDADDFGFDDSDYDFESSDFTFNDDDDFDSDFDGSDDDDDYNDYAYGIDDSRYSNSDIDFDYDDDSDYGYGDDFIDRSDRFRRSRGGSRRDRDFGFSDGDSDSDDDDVLKDFDDDLDDVSFGRRRRTGRKNKRRGGRRLGHHGRVRTLSARQARSTTGGEDADIEIDDASANPEDIPIGYFDRQETQGSRMSPTTSGRIDFPGFRLVIREANNWWKFNQNVCLSKEFLRPTELAEEDTDTTVYTVKCSDHSLTEHACNVTESNGTVSTSYQLTYKCCQGYTRLLGDKGCPRKIVKSATKGLSFESLLRSHGYSQKIIGLFGTVLGNDKTKQWTVFVPTKEALDDAVRMVSYRVPREEPIPEWFVRTVLNHFVQPARPTGSLRSGQVLPTLAKAGGGLLVTKTKQGGVLVNCRSIVKANQPFNQYSLVHFTSSVLGIHQSNLYQLMLKRLEQVYPLDTAKKLLAPIKLILTGTMPATVFMHMPSNDELDNNCYARNLLSATVRGVECNASLATPESLRTFDGKFLRIIKSGKSVVIGGNRVLISSDHMASNGVMHIVNATESLTGFGNEVTRRLKSSDLFKPLFTRPGRAEGSLTLLIPPIKGSHSYANTSARWDNASELAKFGRRHLLDNATLLMGRTVRLSMLDGVQRDFVQLTMRQASGFNLGRNKPVRHQFVDCVRIVRTEKDCGGTVYRLLKSELPDFLVSPTTQSYMNSSNAPVNYRVVQKIVQFALARNVTDLASRLHLGDATLVLLKDADMHTLSDGLLARRRPPTAAQMIRLTTWFAHYFVASKQICAVKSLIPSVTVPVLRFELRPCLSMICAFKRQVSSDLKRIQLRPDVRVTVREGFLLPGKLVR